MSKPVDKRKYVSNSPSAITALYARKNFRVQANNPAIQSQLQHEPDIRRSRRMNQRDASPTSPQGPSLGVSMNDAHTDSQPINQFVPSDTNVETSPIVGVQGPTPAELPRKKPRGRTRGLNADKVHEQIGKKLPITLVDDIGRPTGPYAEMFANEIGFIVRNHAPLDVKTWSKVKPVDLEKLVNRVLNKYDVDMSLPLVHRHVHRTFATSFSSFRYKLKKYFLKFLTKEEAKQNKHPEVRTEEEWIFLCDYFSSDEFQNKSTKNAENRSKLKHHHKAGSKSFMSHASKANEVQGAIERFESKYKSKTKGWDLGAKEKWDEMVFMRADTTEEDGTRIMTDEEICKRVLGEKSGYIKGCGFGPRPTPAKPSQSSLHQMNEKNKALEDKVQSLEAQTKKLIEIMEKFTGQHHGLES